MNNIIINVCVCGASLWTWKVSLAWTLLGMEHSAYMRWLVAVKHGKTWTLMWEQDIFFRQSCIILWGKSSNRRLISMALKHAPVHMCGWLASSFSCGLQLANKHDMACGMMKINNLASSTELMSKTKSQFWSSMLKRTTSCICMCLRWIDRQAFSF